MRLLVVDDEATLGATLARGFRAEGFEVELASDGLAGLELASTGSFDVIVLDVLMPGMNGFAVCRELRRRGISTPVLLLTAKQGEFDEAEGLELGADDFLRKPFSFVVLAARVRALIRRSAVRADEQIDIGDLRLDATKRTCTRDGVPIRLSPREFSLLWSLAQHEGGVMTKADLLTDVWGFDFDGNDNIVEVYIRYLRAKVDRPFDRSSIQTVRAEGYRLVDDRLETQAVR